MQSVGQPKLHKIFASDNTRYQNKHILKQCILYFSAEACAWSIHNQYITSKYTLRTRRSILGTVHHSLIALGVLSKLER